MIVLLGSSILNSLIPLLPSENCIVIAKKGGTLNFDLYEQELKKLAPKEVRKVILLFFGGNDLWTGRIVKKGRKIHYHMKSPRPTIKEVGMKYWVFYKKCLQLMPFAEYRITLPLARRPFSNEDPEYASRMCNHCIFDFSFTSLRILQKELLYGFQNTSCQIDRVVDFHKFLFIHLKDKIFSRPWWIRAYGSNPRNWQIIYKRILASDQIHLNEEGKQLVAKYVNKHVLRSF